MPPATTRLLRTPILVALIAAACALAAAAPASARPQAATHIVQLRPGTTLAQGRALVRAAGGRVTATVPIINSVAGRLPAGAAAALARDPHVAAVSANSGVAPQTVTAPADASPTATSADPTATTAATTTGDTAPVAPPDASRLVSAYPRAVSAPSAWSTTTGRGVGVAVIDTGIAGELPDFAAADGTSRVVASAVVNPAATTAADTYGHGTHVAGIIAGDGSRRDAADPAAGQYIGIAPEADLVSVKVGDDHGDATVLDVINGLQFVVDNKDAYNIRVVNLSLESTTPASYRTDPLDAAVEAAWFHGIVVVAAAGNRGTAADAADYAPGNDPFAITVGAVDDQGTATARDDDYAPWSSIGETQDDFDKPDVAAPGAHIVSTLAPDSDFTRLCPECVVDGGYIRAGGTSMAAPVVSGVAALTLQLHPEWTPDQVKSTIIATSRNVSGHVDEVNAAAATAVTAPVSNANKARPAPNDLVDPVTGDIDYARSSWSRSSWSVAPDPLAAVWARSSWSCVCATEPSAPADPSRSSWSRSSWSTKWTY